METTQAPINRWMDEQNNENIGISFIPEKELSADICYNMDEPWKPYMRWSEPCGTVLHYYTYMNCLE